MGKEKRGWGFSDFFLLLHGMKWSQTQQKNSGKSCPWFCVFLLASIERVGCFLVKKNDYLLAPDSFFVEMIEIDYNLYEPFILVDFDTSYTEVCKLRIVMV